MKILIIEDNVAEACILAKTLEIIFGKSLEIIHSLTLDNGVATLDRLDGRLDLLFLDLHLPDSPNWRTTYDRIAPYVTKMPVIVISSNNDKNVAKELLRRGAGDYIIKGSKRRDADLLKETVEFALCRHRALKNLIETVEREKQCVHWLTGGYSVQ